LAPAAEAALRAHGWPGNVRELKNAIEQAVVLAAGTVIGPEHLALVPGRDDRSTTEGEPAFRLPAGGMSMAGLERDLLRQALARAGWNVTAAARLLGLSRDTLRYRIAKHELRPE
jgi:DNA-binding NtrC family response regulator